MKKKPAHTPAIAPAQLDALRRLARAGKVMQALDRLDALQARHPGFKPLYGLAWELASMAEAPHWAVARALDWTRASPNSPAAWQALRDDAFAAGYIALGLHAVQCLARLEGGPDEAPEDLDTPFGKMRFAEALANDTARVCMAVGHLDAALAALDGFEHISLRNNAALIRFLQGDVAGALAAFEENWRRETRNLFALGSLIRLRLWTRGLDFAAGLAAPLKATPALRSDDALAKVQALLVLGDWQGADAAWRESAQAEFWQGPQEIDKSGAFDFAGGIAALRLGDLEAMAERFRDAGENLKAQRTLIERIEADAAWPELGEAPDIALGDLAFWFPQAWIDRLKHLGKDGGKEAKDGFGTLLRGCDAHPDYLGRVAEFGGELGRILAISILDLRAREGDAAALQALIGLLARPCGPDRVRADLHAVLAESGLLPAGGTVSMLAHGKVREIRGLALEIHARASPPTLPPESQVRLEEVFALLARNKLEEGMALLQDLIARHPDVPILYNNLAGIKEGLGHPDGEVEAMLQKALELDPDYLFAIAGLARLAAKRGEAERAQAMLAPLLERPSYHFSEWRSILMAQLAIAHQRGELGLSINIKKQIEALQERFA